MKKSFFIGLLLFSVVLGLSGCNSTPRIIGRKFNTSTEQGLTLDYTEIWEDGNFTETVIMNTISYRGEVFKIKKLCSWEETGIIFPEGDFVISGRTVNNLKWENGKAWVINCYDGNSMDFKLGDDTLARVQFGWCNCNVGNKTERVFVVSTVTYLAAGGIGGKSFIAFPQEIF